MPAKTDIEVISLFVDKERQRRLIGLVESGKRGNIFKYLKDPDIFDPRYLTEISGREREVNKLISSFSRLGMSNVVYVISERSDWDEREFDMPEFVNTCWSEGFDTIGFYRESKTAFYEWHESGSTFSLSGHKTA